MSFKLNDTALYGLLCRTNVQMHSMTNKYKQHKKTHNYKALETLSENCGIMVMKAVGSGKVRWAGSAVTNSLQS